MMTKEKSSFINMDSPKDGERQAQRRILRTWIRYQKGFDHFSIGPGVPLVVIKEVPRQ